MPSGENFLSEQNKSYEDKRWVVYAHINKINNKVYIGITSIKPYYRRWQNGKHYKNNRHFNAAIQKYGWDNFAHEILFENLSKDEAFKKEIETIKFYNSTNPNLGYNISYGGSAPMLGRHHSLESRGKMSENNGKYWKGRHLSDITIKKLSISKSGTSSWNKGIPQREETKEKISKKLKLFHDKDPRTSSRYGKFGSLNPTSKTIYCIETGKEYIGIREASRLTGIPSPNITRSLTSNGKYSAGKWNKQRLHWIYSEGNMNNKTIFNYIAADWTRIKNHCRTADNKKFTNNEASSKFKKNLLISEHSPIRLLEFDWSWNSIYYWLSTEWSRHKFEKFISTQRDDRFPTDIPRGEKRQDSLVNFDGYANMQNLIDAWRKRLCFMATKDARELAEDFKSELRKTHKIESDVLVPNCVYRCGCPEFKTCGYYNKFLKWCKDNSKIQNYFDINSRYDLYNEYFYTVRATKDITIEVDKINNEVN